MFLDIHFLIFDKCKRHSIVFLIILVRAPVLSPFRRVMHTRLRNVRNVFLNLPSIKSSPDDYGRRRKTVLPALAKKSTWVRFTYLIPRENMLITNIICSRFRIIILLWNCPEISIIWQTDYTCSMDPKVDISVQKSEKYNFTQFYLIFSNLEISLKSRIYGK